MRKLAKRILLLAGLSYCLFSLSYNLYQHSVLQRAKLPFEQGWYEYTQAYLATDEDIYPRMIETIKPQQQIFISMFIWFYHKDSNQQANIIPYDLQFAEYLHKQKAKGDIFIDSLNLDYQLKPDQAFTSAAMQAAPEMNWHVMTQPTALPNNLFMWLFHNPWTQELIEKFFPVKLQQIYKILCLSSNHQKVVVLDQGRAAWLGTRNFNRLNWNNHDQMVFISGDIAKKIYAEAARTIVRLNPNQTSAMLKQAEQADAEFKPQVLGNSEQQAKLLTTAEAKPVLQYLISHAVKIDAQIGVFADPDLISELNRFLARKGQLRLLMDANQYSFSLKMPFMPNIIPLTDIKLKETMRIMPTDFQMHVKSALFTLEDGRSFYLTGSANWTTGALDHYSFNDLGLVIADDAKINGQYLTNFNKLWQQASPVDDISIEQPRLKYYLARLMLWIGYNPW